MATVLVAPFCSPVKLLVVIVAVPLLTQYEVVGETTKEALAGRSPDPEVPVLVEPPTAVKVAVFSKSSSATTEVAEVILVVPVKLTVPDPQNVVVLAEAVTTGDAVTVIVPVAFTEPQPPVKGIL